MLRGDFDTPERCRYAVRHVSARSTAAEPNRHPADPTIRLRTPGGELDVALRSGEVVTVAATQRIELELEPSAGDERRYEVPVNGGAAFETRTEELAPGWLRTAGAFESDGLGGGMGPRAWVRRASRGTPTVTPPLEFTPWWPMKAVA